MNVLTVTGRLTADPVRRDTPKGVVCEFRIAVDGQRRLRLPSPAGRSAGTCRDLRRAPRRVTGPLRVDGTRRRRRDAAGTCAPTTSRSARRPTNDHDDDVTAVARRRA